MQNPRSERTELTHSQLQIWVGQRRSPSSPLYNMAFAFVFEGELQAGAFCDAWDRVVQSSDALCTSVVERSGVAARVPVSPERCATERLDLSGAREPSAELERWARARCSSPLPLDGPLVDSVLVALGGRSAWYLNQHHLIADAWSTVLLYRQMAAEYAARIGADVEVPRLHDYYPAAAALSSRRVSSKAASAAREHWAERSDGVARTTTFYGNQAPERTNESTRYSLELDATRTRALDSLSQSTGWRSFSPELSRFSLYATLLIAWLHRISGQSALGFDAPVAGRTTPEAKQSIGLFIEMFPFRIDVQPEDTLRSLGERCLAEAQLLLRHSLPGTSSPSGATASNVVLNFVPLTFGTFAGVPATVEWIHPGHSDGVHALRVQVHDFSDHGRTTLHFDFNRGVIASPEQSQRALQHFENLLDAALADPDRPIAELPILCDQDRDRLAALHADSPEGTATPLPERSVVTSFLERANAHPDRIALRQGTVELTYAELAERSAALATHLVSEGLQDEDRVAILSRRSVSTVVAILASLRAGGAYVPVDPNYPRARIERILENCGARALLWTAPCRREEVADLASSGMAIVEIEDAIREGRDALGSSPGDRERVSTSPRLDQLAYLIYTSGSTGEPKGVLVEHRGLADYLGWAKRLYVRGDRLTFPLFTSLSFDLTVTSLFLPLVTGGTLEIYPESDGPIDSALMDVIAANSVDFIKLTPSHLSLLQSLEVGPSRIRRMVVGGEDLKTSLARSISARWNDRLELYNEYGPTEAIVGCTVHRFDPRADTGRSVPIGVPADHAEVEILNQAQTAEPVGVPGELWVSRVGLARGYHRLPEETAKRFRPRPAEPGTKRYRTGDLVRLNDSGRLEHLGRIDRQLKISGLRVEPGEIEALLLSHPAVSECTVLARRSGAKPAVVSSKLEFCARCGLPSHYPRARFDADGVCNVCHVYDAVKERAQAYFKTEEELEALFEQAQRERATHNVEVPYDCMMLLSGGKDSTYALGRLVDMGLSVLAFTLDNGFISEGAKENMRRVTAQLGVPLEMTSTPTMNAIFRDSLERFSNVCHGCFKTIYTLSTRRAHELGIPIIVTGLSRGQMFETRLTEELFIDGRFSAEEVDAAVLAARKVYHRVHDEVRRSLDVRLFDTDDVFERIRFVDFYRYCDVGLDEVLSYLGSKVPWVRPEDTGRSTNCLINDIGIWVHKRERGFHNYALPYSWDVRLGHKTREQALAELNDELDLQHVQRTLLEIGFDPDGRSRRDERLSLEAFYVQDPNAQPAEESELRAFLGESLPAPIVPSTVRPIDAIPLTAHGKVDDQALPRPIPLDPTSDHVAPRGPVEEYLAGLWSEELGHELVGAQSDFFELGGTSLGAMEVTARLCQEFDLELPLESLFEHPSLRELARLTEQRILDDVAGMSVAEQRELLGE